MKSPFKFLDSYTKDDRGIFFGRDLEIEELYHRVFESRILLVYGISGTGKSSLIHCGLANKFQDTDWLPIVVRRGGNIIESLSAGINASSITKKHTDLNTPAMFRKAVRSLYLDHYKPVFFIFDQFEELFIFGSKEERKSFIQIVKLLTEGDLQCRMIFVMREEYMASVTEFEKYIPTFFSNRVRIEKMSHLNALEAINGSCEMAGIGLDEGFGESMLERLGPERGEVDLTYLQVYLDRIYRSACEENSEKIEFTKFLLEKSGNVYDLLGEFLEEQVSSLSKPEEGLLILKSLVSAGGSRKQSDIKEISEFISTFSQNTTHGDVRDILQSFVNLRILHDKDQNGKFELRHDALAAKIFEKITSAEREILEIRQFVEISFLNYKKRKAFLTTQDIKYISPYETRLFLNKELSGFLEESKKRLNSARRRRRSLAFVSAILLFVVLSGFTLWALIEKRKADEASKRQLESILKLNENFEIVQITQDKTIKDLYHIIEMAYATHPGTVRNFWNKADKIKIASDNLALLIKDLQSKILSESGEGGIDSAANLSLELLNDNLNPGISESVMNRVGDDSISNGSRLSDKIDNFRKTVFGEIPEKDWDKITFRIDTSAYSNSSKKSWIDANFKNVTVAGSIANLNNLLTEVFYTEIDALNFLNSFIDVQYFSFNKIMPVINPGSNFINLGSKYQAKLFLSAYDTRSNLEAFIFPGLNNHEDLDTINTTGIKPLTSKNGIFDIELETESTGIKQYSGFIQAKGPDGDTRRYAFTSEFSVGEPAIEISPVAGNVIYRGIDNTVDINIPGVSSDRISIALTNGSIVSKGSYYILRAGQTGNITIRVKAIINDNVITFPPFEFRVKDLPDPTVSLGGSRGGKLNRQRIIESAGLVAKVENLDYPINFEFDGFTVMVIDAAGSHEERTKGNEFSRKQLSLISRLKPGDFLFIKDITVIGPEKRKRDLNGLIFTITD